MGSHWGHFSRFYLISAWEGMYLWKQSKATQSAVYTLDQSQQMSSVKDWILNMWTLWIIWMISLITAQLFCSVNAIIDNLWTNECYCIPMPFYLRTLKFDFILVSCMAVFPHYCFNNLKMIFSMYAVEKQSLGWFWHTDSSALTSICRTRQVCKWGINTGQYMRIFTEYRAWG